MLLRHYLDQGVSKADLAERFDVSRRTVYHWIRSGQLDRDLDQEPLRYRPRPAVPTKLDPYKPIIRARLEDFPDLSARRLLDEIRPAGYAGGYTQLKEFVIKVRPRPEPEPIIRFETAPGHQGQVDYARFQLPWGKRSALVVVLGYSRLLWIHFFPREDMQSLMRGLEAAFRFFGGVPRELLFDQMRSVIVRDLRPEGGRLVENAEFLRFSDHWGFRPRACRPYRAQTKGKVERPISYLRRSFFYGRTFVNDPDLDMQLEGWLAKTANVRIHGTTGERPVDRFEAQERAVLLPLALRSYEPLVPRLTQPEPRAVTPLPLHVPVERRPLAAYAQLAGGVR